MKPSILIAWIAALVTAGNASADTRARFVLPSGVAVRITEAKFDASKFEVRGCLPESSTCLINGRVPAGTNALGLPETYVKEIVSSRMQAVPSSPSGASSTASRFEACSREVAMS